MCELHAPDDHHRVADGQEQEGIGKSLFNQESAQQQHYGSGIFYGFGGHAHLLCIGVPGHDKGYQQHCGEFDHLGRIDAYSEYGQRTARAVDDLAEKHHVDHHGHTDDGEAEGEGNEVGVVAL